MKFSRYYLAAFTSFAIWGFFSLALKPLHTYPALDILFYRIFFAAVILAFLQLFFRKAALRDNLKIFRAYPVRKKRMTVLLTLGGGLLLTANWFFFIHLMNNISIKAASFAYLVCPILTTLLAYLILNEKLSKWQWVAVGISALSCALLSFRNPSDLLFSMIVAATYALYLISQRKNNEIDRLLVLSLQLIFSALVLLPFYPFQSGPLPVEAGFYGLILVIAIVFTIIPLFLNLYALKGVNSSTMGILLYINPLLNFIIAVAYYHEEINTFQVVSYALILISIIIFNERLIFRRKKSDVPG